MGGLYIHIPFCPSKCRYCDFLSGPAAEADQAAYIEALLIDLRLQIQAFDQPLETIFIGGGTPSSLSRANWARLLEGMADLPGLGAVQEWTVEVNPGDLTAGLLADWLAAGVNRLSMGVQSFDDATLKILGRRHDRQMALAAYETIRAAGFSNVNLDLMYGLPGMTLDSWQATVKAALALAPSHLSLYGLIVEEGTPIAQDLAAGRLPDPDEDLARASFLWQREALAAAGYRQYEISNYAQEGEVCRHNRLYWSLGDWLGCGLGASGQVGGRFTRLTGDPALYRSSLAEGRLPLVEDEVWSREDLMSEQVILALRQTEGLWIPSFDARYGAHFHLDYAVAIKAACTQGLAVMDGQYFKPSLEGLLLNNELAILFL
ncbi:radical SAM family heme chaperone HemW [Peptococcus simiae]|uniref:radical SAM family heme chaperone HemW n=1 Tax=Peptococcus simiae TaxID=1643805 RepID=UPI003980700D